MEVPEVMPLEPAKGKAMKIIDLIFISGNMGAPF
jgi:hypothetical protein